MSKKQKGRPTPVGPNPVVKPVSALSAKPQQPLTAPSEIDDLPDSKRPFELIRFDKRVKITLGTFVAVFVLFVLFKWHYVSLPMWNTLLPDGSPATRGLVAGTPKRIRMDDYAVGAPWILSNALNGYPQENEAIGGLKAPLMTVPVKHPIVLFKIGSWGMFLPDLDRTYAWMYDISPLVLLIGAFLFFLLVTRSDYWLSLTGSLTLLLSSGTVQWSFIPSSMIGYCCATFVTVVYLLYERKPLQIALFSLLLIWLLCAYILVLYPPYQVPLAYLFGLALIGYAINNRRTIFPLKSVLLKIGLLAGAAVLAGLVLSTFFSDVQETLKAVTGTVYPGQRSETGGTGFIANWYSEYYSWFFSEQVFPKSWLNICELSHYLNFAPVIIPLTGALFVLNRRVDWMLISVSVFVLFMWVWIEVGFGEELAKASLMSMVPTRRAQIPMGVGGIVLLFLYLNAIRNNRIRDTYKQVPVWGNALAVVGVIGFVIYTAYVNVNDSDGLIKPYQTFMPVVFFSLMNVMLIFTIPIRYRVSVFCAGLLLFLMPNLKANPLSKGVSPITENAFYKAVRQFVEQDPQARWLVNGNQFITYMVTATGAKQITGVKYIPDRKHIFSILDPQMKRDSAYNRYAHVTNQSYIDGKDSVILVNQYEDGYVIAMDPCSPRMKKLNVKYQVFDHQPQPVEVRCMKSVATLGSLTIYQANP